MKETKLTKRIFAGFVAFIVILLISCGDLQVFADYSFTFTSTSGSPNYSKDYSLWKWNGSSWSPFDSFTVLINGSAISRTYTCSAGDIFQVRCSYRYNNVTRYRTILADGVVISSDSSSPSLLASGVTLTDYSSDTPQYYYFTFGDPSIPTPEPTPTPVPTPTPEPTFNPDQPTYTTFFNHLLNDGNNALNALYLSWTQANNKFYTGIFFIGLPIMIGIFGIVASIFFGGDD